MQRIDAVTVLGVIYDNVTRAETLDIMEKLIGESGSHMLCTPNADHLLRAQHDHEFRRILESADLVVSDGMAVVYASRWLGTPFKENVGGRLLLPGFAARATRKGYRLFLLGGGEVGVAEQAAERLCAQYPGLIIAGTYMPPFMAEFGERETEHMLAVIHRAHPDVLFVCLGTPKQEKWIARNLSRLNVPVSIGIGAALDMIAGRVYEPPAWISGIGLEWLVKLAQDPGRLWRRYLVGGPRFLWIILRQKVHGDRAKRLD